MEAVGGFSILSGRVFSFPFTDGFKPRRSIVFASWSGGEYGSIGATEWLEVRLAHLSWKHYRFLKGLCIFFFFFFFQT